MDWILGDVIKTHGASGMAPLLPSPPPDSNTIIHEAPPPGAPLPSIEIIPEPQNVLPGPRKSPDTMPSTPPQAHGPGSPAEAVVPAGGTTAPAANGAPAPAAATSLSGEPASESKSEQPRKRGALWKFFYREQ